MQSAPPSQPSSRNTRQFLLGLGTGLIPLIILLVAFGISLTNSSLSSRVNTEVDGLNVFVITYLAAIMAMIGCLVVARVRSIGYGLLAAVLSTPVIAPIACGVISNLSQYFR